MKFMKGHMGRLLQQLRTFANRFSIEFETCLCVVRAVVYILEDILLKFLLFNFAFDY